jgi:Zn-dependent protease with chaperone function/chemotaxis regulatin CheY-phosphate phosphatase CheZ
MDSIKTEKSKPHEMLDTLPKKIKKRMKSPFYIIALIINTLIMILLPILYFLLIVIVGILMGLYLYFVPEIIFSSGSSYRNITIRILIVAGPPIAALILIIFMLRVLFSKKYHTNTHTFELKDEKLLAEFINKIADSVGAPRPHKILIDTNINASAAFAPGIFSVFSRKLILTIGYPLLATLTTGELAGILAHEFGHFSQGIGMTLSRIIININYWFHRIVYERDSFDRWLKSSTENTDWRIAIVLYTSIAMVWLTRRILWCFMAVGNLVSLYLLRQMEYDADRYGIELVGTEQFKQTFFHLNYLQVAWEKTINWISHSWEKNKLPDDIGYLLEANTHMLGDELKEQIKHSTQNEKDSIWNTHPSLPKRFRKAEKLSVKGKFSSDDSVTLFFKDFDDFSKNASYHYFNIILYNEIKNAEFIPSELLLESSNRNQNRMDAFSRFFGDVTGILLPVSFENFNYNTYRNDNEKIAYLEKLHNSLNSEKENIKNLSAKFDEILGVYIQIFQGHSIIKAGYSIDFNQFGFKGTTIQEAEAAKLKQFENLTNATELLQSSMRPLVECLVAALPHNTNELNDEIEPLFSFLERVNKNTETTQRIQGYLLAVKLLLNQKDYSGQVVSNMMKLISNIQNNFKLLCDDFKDQPYPFYKEEEYESVSEYLHCSAILDTKNLDLVQKHTQLENSFNIFSHLYCLVLGEIILKVESEENRLGLEHATIQQQTR